MYTHQQRNVLIPGCWLVEPRHNNHRHNEVHDTKPGRHMECGDENNKITASQYMIEDSRPTTSKIVSVFFCGGEVLYFIDHHHAYIHLEINNSVADVNDMMCVTWCNMNGTGIRNSKYVPMYIQQRCHKQRWTNCCKNMQKQFDGWKRVRQDAQQLKSSKVGSPHPLP